MANRTTRVFIWGYGGGQTHRIFLHTGILSPNLSFSIQVFSVQTCLSPYRYSQSKPVFLHTGILSPNLSFSIQVFSVQTCLSPYRYSQSKPFFLHTGILSPNLSMLNTYWGFTTSVFVLEFRRCLIFYLIFYSHVVAAHAVPRGTRRDRPYGEHPNHGILADLHGYGRTPALTGNTHTTYTAMDVHLPSQVTHTHHLHGYGCTPALTGNTHTPPTRLWMYTCPHR